MSDYYLAAGLAAPMATDLDAPYWSGLRDNQLCLQRCRSCGKFQWGPEWICHHCHSDDLAYEEVPAVGEIYSYERVWHPVHPALSEQGSYLIVLVRLPQANDVRLVGNLLGDPHAQVNIGARVRGVFEHHEDADHPYTLLQWELMND